jgi:hypothetical protein
MDAVERIVNLLGGFTCLQGDRGLDSPMIAKLTVYVFNIQTVFLLNIAYLA